MAVAGAGYANHAEINYVPKNLVAHIPEGVAFQEAAFTTVASIALQGLRIGKPELGDNVAVVGLGLIGLIVVQLLKANGCRVIGIDLDPSKVELGLRLGMDEGVVSSVADAATEVDRFTRGRGADHTLITAATKSNQPVELAGEITDHTVTDLAGAFNFGPGRLLLAQLVDHLVEVLIADRDVGLLN